MHHKLLPRQYLILGLVAVCAPLGDSCLARGMIGIPSISLAHPGALIAAVFTPWIASASPCSSASSPAISPRSPGPISHSCFRPRPSATSSSRCFARFWLHETISLERWAGIVLITLGVGFVAQGPSLTQHPLPSPKSPQPVSPQR